MDPKLLERMILSADWVDLTDTRQQQSTEPIKESTPQIPEKSPDPEPEPKAQVQTQPLIPIEVPYRAEPTWTVQQEWQRLVEAQLSRCAEFPADQLSNVHGLDDITPQLLQQLLRSSATTLILPSEFIPSPPQSSRPKTNPRTDAPASDAADMHPSMQVAQLQQNTRPNTSRNLLRELSEQSTSTSALSLPISTSQPSPLLIETHIEPRKIAENQQRFVPEEKQQRETSIPQDIVLPDPKFVAAVPHTTQRKGFRKNSWNSSPRLSSTMHSTPSSNTTALPAKPKSASGASMSHVKPKVVTTRK